MEKGVVRAQSLSIVLLGIKLFFVRILYDHDSYNRYLHNQMRKINKDLLPSFSGLLADCIKLTKKRSANFKTSDNEAGTIISLYPLFRPYYHDVYVVVKEHRRKKGLKL